MCAAGCGLWAVCVRAGGAVVRASGAGALGGLRDCLRERRPRAGPAGGAIIVCVHCTLYTLLCARAGALKLPARPPALASRVSDCVMCLRSDVGWPTLLLLLLLRSAGLKPRGPFYALFCARLPRILHANVHCWLHNGAPFVANAPRRTHAGSFRAAVIILRALLAAYLAALG